MIGKEVKIIEYSPKVDMWNCITHAAGVFFAVAAMVLMINKAQGIRYTFSAVIYALTLIAVYTVSTVYHGLKPGEKKRIARMVDHSTVPFLIAGTTTPCALITLYEISNVHGIVILTMGWLCACFGLVSKLFFFEKLKKLTMAVYIISGAVMLLSAVPVMDKIDSDAFMKLVFGCVFYIIGAVFCGLGVKRPWLHVVFHMFVLMGSAVHFHVIYTSVI